VHAHVHVHVHGLKPIAFRGVVLDWSRPYVVGVLNVTPDSFSDGGRYLAAEAAIEHGLALVAAGADVVDVGGESTRPGAAAVSAEDEAGRVEPVVRGLAAAGALVSIDTTKASVARVALAAGAEIVNDIAGGLFDPAIVEVAAAAGAAYVCGHVRGADLAAVHRAEASPPSFDEVAAELGARLAALPVGLRGRVVADPGLGFGKRGAENLELCRRAGELADRLSCPVMVGASRKRFLGELVGPAGDRDAATVGVSLAAAACGAHLVRVHDVARTAVALAAYRAVTAG
jgi:dihydropteroate synthase